MAERDDLIHAARHAAENAYAPFSKFRVGAALAILDKEGEEHIVTGCNVENASYSLTLCGERNALSSAVTQFGLGQEPDRVKVTQLAVACVDAPDTNDPADRAPCGACRQWIAELAPDAIIYLDGIEREFHISDLFPYGFRLAH